MAELHNQTRRGVIVAWLIAVVWTVAIGLVYVSHLNNQHTVHLIRVLDERVNALKSTLDIEAPYRRVSTSDMTVYLQQIDLIRRQLMAENSFRLMVQDTNQLLYSTERYTELFKRFVATELQLQSLVEQIKRTRIKYADDEPLYQRLYQLSAYVFEAMFGDVNTSATTYRSLDLLFSYSEQLPDEQASDLQRLLAETSQVLGAAAQGKYLVRQLQQHAIYAALEQLETDQDKMMSDYLTFVAVVSALCLFALFGLYLSTTLTAFTGAARGTQLAVVEPQPDNESGQHSRQRSYFAASNGDNGTINVPFILDALGHDQQAVETMLRVFIDDHLCDGDHLRLLLKQGDCDQAQRVVHSLKGVAANLDARQLKDTVVQIEKMLRNHHSVSGQWLDQLDNHLNATIEDARHYLNRQVA
ncbi:Hpt domain-containing protein [Vibrio sp.]|uniref:Hpt domain-containing protein n=1 Tax=Vibrio sp. TaxID=678 RepID=UPI003D0B5D4A